MTRSVPPRTVLYLGRLALLGILFLSAAGILEAGSVTVTWSQNPEEDIAGYIVSIGTSSLSYTTSVDVGNNTSYQFPEATPGITYYFAVRAYNVGGLQSDYSSEAVYSPPAAFSITSVGSDRGSPQQPGATITFSATATGGGDGPRLFAWTVETGGGIQESQDWSETNTFTWRPTTQGSYAITVYARADASDQEGVPPVRTVPFVIGGSALSVDSLTPNLTSPQKINTSIIFRTGASGGSGPYQYKWLVARDDNWTIASDWSSSNAFTWVPAAAGSYLVGVWARSEGNLVDAPENQAAGTAVAFEVTDAFLRLTGLTANRAAPQTASGAIVFTASSLGSPAPEYCWWVFDGVDWAISQNWSSDPQFIWTPTEPNPNYQIQVRVRDPSDDSLMLTSLATMTMPFPVSAVAHIREVQP